MGELQPILRLSGQQLSWYLHAGRSGGSEHQVRAPSLPCSVRPRRQTPDYYDLCRWKTQNVDVEDDRFILDPAAVGPDCTAARGCGYVGVFSEYGSDPSWSPYHGTAVEYHITFGQDNHFTGNVYNGPWKFMALADGETVSWSAWRVALAKMPAAF